MITPAERTNLRTQNSLTEFFNFITNKEHVNSILQLHQNLNWILVGPQPINSVNRSCIGNLRILKIQNSHWHHSNSQDRITIGNIPILFETELELSLLEQHSSTSLLFEDYDVSLLRRKLLRCIIVYRIYFYYNMGSQTPDLAAETWSASTC